MWGFIILGIVGVLLIIIVGWLISGYNSFVKKRNRVENGFSQIDIQCKKRFDLVPNLVETVKGYAKHEKDTLEGVIAARNMGVGATSAGELANADAMLTQTLGKLFALSEAYPELKANTNFMELQRELVNLEKAIAISRSFYNDAVMIYNNAIMTFPSNLIAKLFKFKKADFFSAEGEERKAVKVNLFNE